MLQTKDLMQDASLKHLQGSAPVTRSGSDQVSDERCIDPVELAAIRPDIISAAEPFPWCAQENLIRETTYRKLLDELPQLINFKKVLGKRRQYGQASHDRFALDYTPGISLSPIWQKFVDELYYGPYIAKIREVLGRDDFFLTSHWHYTPSGCSVSPHCDADWKLGSHIFYFNDATTWDKSWGGATVVLDDDGAFNYESAPNFEDFHGRIDDGPTGNRSFLFLRTDHSWHGVEPLRCPEDKMRKVFIVEFREDSLRERFRARTGI